MQKIQVAQQAINDFLKAIEKTKPQIEKVNYNTDKISIWGKEYYLVDTPKESSRSSQIFR
jgi:hypothetical protein